MCTRAEHSTAYGCMQLCDSYRSGDNTLEGKYCQLVQCHAPRQHSGQNQTASEQLLTFTCAGTMSASALKDTCTHTWAGRTNSDQLSFQAKQHS